MTGDNMENARVPKDLADSVNEKLGVKDHSKSELIRSAFRLYDTDSTSEDFFDKYMSGDVNSLGEYTLDCMEASYEMSLTEEERNEVLFGITNIISGVQNEYKPEAMQGVEKLAHIDDRLVEDAAEYLDNLGGKGSYWKD